MRCARDCTTAVLPNRWTSPDGCGTADLERNGKSLAAMDLLIASHALCEGCTLVTTDQAFANVADLQREAW